MGEVVAATPQQPITEEQGAASAGCGGVLTLLPMTALTAPCVLGKDPMLSAETMKMLQESMKEC